MFGARSTKSFATALVLKNVPLTTAISAFVVPAVPPAICKSTFTPLTRNVESIFSNSCNIVAAPVSNVGHTIFVEAVIVVEVTPAFPVKRPETVRGESKVAAVEALLNIVKRFVPPVNPREREFVASPVPLYVNDKFPEFPVSLLLPNLIGTELVAAETTFRVMAPTLVLEVVARIPKLTFADRSIPFVAVLVAERPAFAETRPEAVIVVEVKPAFAVIRPEAVIVVDERDPVTAKVPDRVDVPLFLIERLLDAPTPITKALKPSVRLAA